MWGVGKRDEDVWSRGYMRQGGMSNSLNQGRGPVITTDQVRRWGEKVKGLLQKWRRDLGKERSFLKWKVVAAS